MFALTRMCACAPAREPGDAVTKLRWGVAGRIAAAWHSSAGVGQREFFEVHHHRRGHQLTYRAATLCAAGLIYVMGGTRRTIVRTPVTHPRRPRIDVRKPATLINSDGTEIDATVLDISSDGFRLCVIEDLRVDEIVSLCVDGDQLRAQIRWILGDEAGGCFLAEAEDSG